MQQNYLSQVARRSTFLLLLFTFFLLWLTVVQHKDVDSQSFTPIAFISNAHADEQTGFKSPYTIEASEWQENIKQKAADALAGFDSDLLVVPFQSSVDGHEFDATTRTLLTLTNTRAFKGSTIEVADPLLVAEALGANKSNYESDEIAKLAAQVNANQVLLSFVGYNEYNKLNLSLALFERRDINTQTAWSDFVEVARVSRDDISFGPTTVSYTHLTLPTIYSV